MDKVLVKTKKGKLNASGYNLGESPREVVLSPLIRRLIRDGSLIVVTDKDEPKKGKTVAQSQKATLG